MSALCTESYELAQGVPTNKLHEQGYVSIGCEPCTRPVLPNQHEREGRWWWEVTTPHPCTMQQVTVSSVPFVYCALLCCKFRLLVATAVYSFDVVDIAKEALLAKSNMSSMQT